METLKHQLAKSVITHPGKIITLLTVLVIAAATLLPGLKQNPSPWLLNINHPARVNLAELRENYTGSGDNIFILLEAEKTIFNTGTLDRINKLTDGFEAMVLIDEIDVKTLRNFAKTVEGPPALILSDMLDYPLNSDSLELFENLEESLRETGQWTDTAEKLIAVITARLSPVTEVTSLSNTDNITASSDGLSISPIYDDIPVTAAELEAIKTDVTGNRLFKDILFTDDMKYTSIVIEQALEDSDTENQYRLYERVKTILEHEITGPEAHYISGMPVASATLGHTIQVDSSRLFPIVLGLVVFCLFLSFRMVMGIIAPVVVVILSLILTLALKVLFGVPINVITATLPVFILSIGVADGIHIFSEYRDNILEGMGKKEAVSKTVQDMTAPVVMTSVTTAAAFWALSITEIVQLNHFGLFVAAGTLIAMVFSLLFIPALILVLPGKIRQKKSNKLPLVDTFVNGGLERISRFAVTKPWTVIFTTLLILIVSGYGASNVVVDNNNIKYQLDDSPLVISTEKINEKAAGSSVLSILVEDTGNVDSPFTDPVNLQAIAALTDYIETRPEVGKVTGLTELIKRINFVLNEENPDFDRLPSSVERSFDGRQVSGKDMVSQFLLLYENGGGDVLSDVTLSDYSTINIPVILKVNSSRIIQALMEDITLKAETLLPENLRISFSGSANTMVAATSEIVSGQIISLGISFLLIFLMLMYTFRSFVTGITAMIPLLTTISINFGIMGYFKIPLDIGTAVISSIVIGIGVDYSIHYLKRMNDFTDNGFGFNESIMNTVRHSGKAIMSNAFTVGIGFIAMLFSILTPLITMGWMITVTMFVSALSTIILLPAVLSIITLKSESGRRSDKVVHSQQSAPVYT